MAGEFNIDSQVSGYGSPGATALFGVQQELMRRAQLQQDAEIRRQALLRQQQQDELNRQHVEQEIAASKENVESNKEARAAVAAQRDAATKDATIKGITSALTPGPSTAAAADAVAKIDPTRAALLFARTPTAAVPAVAESSDYEGQPAAAEVPAGETVTYKGTDEQRTSEEHKAFAREVLNGEHDTGNEGDDRYQHMQATQLLGAGKESTIPAGVINGPKPASETAAARKIWAEDLQAKIDGGYAPTADESSRLAVWKKYNPTTVDVENAKANAASKADERTTARAEKTQVFQTKQQFRKDISTEAGKLDTDLERVDRARRVLASPNFLTDAVAAPEFLQIMAGGMGSGLRMTDAELRRVNEAQTLYNQWAGKIAKATGLGEQTTIRDNMRKQMQTMLDTVDAARKRKSKLQQDTLRKLDSAKTPEEVDQLHADYWEAKQNVATTAAPADAGVALPVMKPVTSHTPRVPDF